MPGLTDIRDAAVALLETVLPKGVKVSAFTGELNPKTVKNQSLTMGVVYVAVLEGRNVAPYGSMAIDLEAAFGLFVLTRGGQGQNAREKDGLRLVELVALALHGATFGLPGVSPASVVQFEALTDEDFEKDGIAVWSIVWKQGFTLN